MYFFCKVLQYTISYYSNAMYFVSIYFNLDLLLSGLAVPVVGVNAFATAKNLIDKMVTVR